MHPITDSLNLGDKIHQLAQLKNIRCCIIIPCFNHGNTLAKVVSKLEGLGLDFILVDDGSVETTRLQCKSLSLNHPRISLIQREQNGGKGMAMIDGFNLAIKKGYTHALQIDADDQHNTDDALHFLAAAAKNPSFLILGAPRFDDSVPKSRLIGRQITKFWIFIETLSFQIQDALCGYRCYPLKSVGKLLSNTKLGHRMDFDPEIAVRLSWMGVKITNIPTQVLYPKDGISNFRMFQDNLLLSWRHTRLVLGMLLRLPLLILAKFKTADTPS